jgi:glycerol-3-phosphate O-acyltransferase
MVVESGLRARARPVTIVPVFIGYDKVFEVGSYFRELRGAAKAPESAEALIKATKVLGHSHGRAYLSFGEPLSLRDYADAHLPGWAEEFGADVRPAGFPDFVRRLAEEVMRRINTAAAVGPVALAACALLSTPRFAATEEELCEFLGHLVALLAAWPRREQLLVPERAPSAILDWATPIARIRRVEHEWGDILTLAPRDATLLTYGRNTIQHLFVLPALVASLFRTRGQLTVEAVLTGCRALSPFLRSEYFLPWEPADSDHLAAQAIELLVERGLLTRVDPTHLRRPPVSARGYAVLAGLGRLLGESLERQAMVLLLLARRGARASVVQREEFLADVRNLAVRLAVLTGREAPEFHDPALFQRYLDTLLDVGLVRAEAQGQLQVDARVTKTAERVVELLSDETRQTLLQLLARRGEREGTSV